ncbi:uncharacterized protein LOC144422975 [Styela clava]
MSSGLYIYISIRMENINNIYGQQIITANTPTTREGSTPNEITTIPFADEHLSMKITETDSHTASQEEIELQCISYTNAAMVSVAVIGGIIIGVLLVFLVQRYCFKKQTASEENIYADCHTPSVSEQAAYEDYHITTYKNGYELPMQMESDSQYATFVGNDGEYQLEIIS